MEEVGMAAAGTAAAGTADTDRVPTGTRAIKVTIAMLPEAMFSARADMRTIITTSTISIYCTQTRSLTVTYSNGIIITAGD